jgi:hypothetical protein
VFLAVSDRHRSAKPGHWPVRRAVEPLLLAALMLHCVSCSREEPIIFSVVGEQHRSVIRQAHAPFELSWTLLNETNSPVSAPQLIPSCACGEATFSPKVVPPHGEGVVKVLVSPQRSARGFFAQLRVRPDKGAPLTLTYQLQVVGQRGVRVMPASVQVDSLHQGDPLAFRVYLDYGKGERPPSCPAVQIHLGGERVKGECLLEDVRKIGDHGFSGRIAIGQGQLCGFRGIAHLSVTGFASVKIVIR